LSIFIILSEETKIFVKPKYYYVGPCNKVCDDYDDDALSTKSMIAARTLETFSQWRRNGFIYFHLFFFTFALLYRVAQKSKPLPNYQKMC